MKKKKNRKNDKIKSEAKNRIQVRTISLKVIEKKIVSCEICGPNGAGY